MYNFDDRNVIVDSPGLCKVRWGEGLFCIIFYYFFEITFNIKNNIDQLHSDPIYTSLHPSISYWGRCQLNTHELFLKRTKIWKWSKYKKGLTDAYPIRGPQLSSIYNPYHIYYIILVTEVGFKSLYYKTMWQLLTFWPWI